MSVSAVSGIPIIELGRTRLSGWGRIWKRFIDVTGSIFFIIFFSPVFLAVSALILLETGHPIFYKNERVGPGGKKFFILKFRSMYKDDCTGEQFGRSGEKALLKETELIREQNAKNGPVYKIKNDPRVTPLGRFIRRWSLDELPQFINVLKGEMSLVGPRPHQPREVRNYTKEQRKLLLIKPGITGLAQISGRSDLNFNDESQLDIFYLENWSIWLDFYIMIKTFGVVLFGRGSY